MREEGMVRMVGEIKKTIKIMNIGKYVFAGVLLCSMVVCSCSNKSSNQGATVDENAQAGNNKGDNADGALNGENADDDVKYIDFTAYSRDKSEHKASEYIKPGQYAMIDFWASWCGPCRAAIPHVREINNAYAGKINVISVSLDSKESAWTKALDDENMEWTQLWAPQDMAETVSAAYGITGIPHIVLINDKGGVIYMGHNPQEVSMILESLLK